MDLLRDVFQCTKSKSNTSHFCFVVETILQHKCESTRTKFSSLSIISLLVYFLLLASLVSPVYSSEFSTNQSFWAEEELHKLKIVTTSLQKINKPYVKTIQSPDGDIIDCVLSHQQLAFDHPLFKYHKPLDPPERPKGHNKMDVLSENFQLWTLSGESCPEGTIPIRRTTVEDILRASSVSGFGRKIIKHVTRDTTSNGHEHAIGYVICLKCGSYLVPLVRISTLLKLVSPELYGDNYPRFFTYWTSDAYQATGCYNLLCSGFVQTNNKIAIGAAISPTSSYDGGQFDITLLIWKDPKHGNWWLEFGSGILIGYWPSFLFTHLGDHANMVQFGGEIVNSMSLGSHTSTQMGSGHFAEEGFSKASYFKNMQVVDWDNNLISLPNLKVLADQPNCYDIQEGVNNVWGNYIYYGGPGRNIKCP
ncbi:hypothetical protein Lal_00040002 [Lupinus albus]|nr:hypothetical protein Lal_00040002 [Lupinus albus]